MRKPIIAGNWKMNKTIEETIEFINEIKDKLNDDKVEAVICAPFTVLKDLKEATKGMKTKTIIKYAAIASLIGGTISYVAHKLFANKT